MTHYRSATAMEQQCRARETETGSARTLTLFALQVLIMEACLICVGAFLTRIRALR